MKLVRIPSDVGGISQNYFRNECVWLEIVQEWVELLRIPSRAGDNVRGPLGQGEIGHEGVGLIRLHSDVGGIS